MEGRGSKGLQPEVFLSCGEMKKCTRCKNILEISSFHKESRMPDGFHSWCRDCSNTWRRVRYWRNPEVRLSNNAASKRTYQKDRAKHIQRTRNSELKRLYKITLVEYNHIMATQGHSCGLCKCETPGGKGAWHMDHDHKTGVIRGVLCHKCNTNIGIYENLIDRVGIDSIKAWLLKGKN